MTTTTTETARKPGGRLPPRFVIRAFWLIHRGIHRFSGGRIGLRPASEKTWGMMRLKTIGRKSGRERCRHPGLLRGRSEPRDDGHERLGRARAGVVAEPPGPSRHDGRAARSDDRRPGSRRDRGGAPSAVGDLGPIRRARGARGLGLAPTGRDRRRHPRASRAGPCATGSRCLNRKSAPGSSRSGGCAVVRRIRLRA